MKMTKTKTLREKEMKIMLRTIKEQQKEIDKLKEDCIPFKMYRRKADGYNRLLKKVSKQQKQIDNLKRKHYNWSKGLQLKTKLKRTK